MTKAHWVALSSVPGVGGKTVTRLLKHFGSVEGILSASEAELVAVPRLKKTQATAITELSLQRTEERIALYEASGIQVITWEDASYPVNLLLTADAPPVLYLRGSLLPSDNRTVAIVGTRQPQPKSADLARQLAADFARRGWTVVSGLALGIDTAAHRGALGVEGRTLAVLGSGVDHIYPLRNKSLAAQMFERGGVLSEVFPEAGVSRSNLIARNRLTSGLSRAVIVVQSSADSGSSNTARRAREQGRLVLAITGRADEHLLAEGAEPLRPEDIDIDVLSARLDAIQLSPASVDPSQPRLF